MPTLEGLPIGTHVRLASGATGVLVYRTFTRARVKLDGRRMREFDVKDPATGEVRHVVAASDVFKDIAPAADVEVVNENEATKGGEPMQENEVVADEAVDAGSVEAAVDMEARKAEAVAEAVTRGHVMGAFRHEQAFGAMHAHWLAACKTCGAGVTVREDTGATPYGGTALKQDCGKARPARPAAEGKKKAKREQTPATTAPKAEADAAATPTASDTTPTEETDMHKATQPTSRAHRAKPAAKRATAKKAPAHATRPAHARGHQAKVFDEFSVSEVVRWMGSKGFSQEQATAALRSQHIDVARIPSVIQRQLHEYCWKKQPVAALNREQQAQLNKFKK